MFILGLIFSGSLFFACESTKNMSKNELISKVSLEKITMGSNSLLEVTKDEILTSTTSRDGASDAGVGNTTEENWKEINRLVNKLELTQIGNWEAPTQARFYDGARATTIIIEVDGKTYNSQSFDEGEPPAQLKELNDYLESLVNQ